ncbi:hypothetical protein [Mesorhizobium sp. WSM3626]|uniref:hypothetical protein n=1 Tax=Mesorhizobium sp. WSM3626 TaxID=1040987 RepID=UPI0012EC985B|nr:hypothetical protein [Mesorhizobium sp. WSM3626]
MTVGRRDEAGGQQHGVLNGGRQADEAWRKSLPGDAGANDGDRQCLGGDGSHHYSP